MVDISPAVGKISPEFQAYINAMRQIQDAKVQSRKEADDLLQETEPVRLFTRSPESSFRHGKKKKALCVVEEKPFAGCDVYNQRKHS